jgi:hypothetical protein
MAIVGSAGETQFGRMLSLKFGGLVIVFYSALPCVASFYPDLMFDIFRKTEAKIFDRQIKSCLRAIDDLFVFKMWFFEHGFSPGNGIKKYKPVRPVTKIQPCSSVFICG